MPAITISRQLANAENHGEEDTIFMQAYHQIQNFPMSTLRRRDQSFRVRFAGEGGHDVGGLYRDLFSQMCTEIRENELHLFFEPPSTNKSRRKPILPRPSLRSALHEGMLEFVGNLFAISTMRHGVTLSIDFSPLLWKILVRDELTEDDLRYVDDVAWKTVSFIRRSVREELGDILADTRFAAVRGDERDLKNPRMVELCPFGMDRLVTPEVAPEYATLLTSFRLHECDYQVDTIRKGISALVPLRMLPMFTWQELEHLICGVADVDIEILQAHTKYVGGVSQTDQHIKFFWDVLSSEFTAEDRTQFLRFVWGRERMSGTEEGCTFQIGPHLRSKEDEDPDQWLPVAHTCFFSLDLPEYSSREITKSRLLFAMNNCNAIDADDTGEGHANMGLTL